MKPTEDNISKIEVFARAKNADEYGNPYASFVAVVSVNPRSYHDKIIIVKEMAWGDSSTFGVLHNRIMPAINEALNLQLCDDDKRICFHFKKVSNEKQLRNPLSWRIGL